MIRAHKIRLVPTPSQDVMTKNHRHMKPFLVTWEVTADAVVWASSYDEARKAATNEDPDVWLDDAGANVSVMAIDNDDEEPEFAVDDGEIRNVCDLDWIPTQDRSLDPTPLTAAELEELGQQRLL